MQVFVEVENDRQHDPLLPGTFVHARIAGPVLQQAIAVPRDAVLGGSLFVADRSELNGTEGAETSESTARASLREVRVTRTLQSLAVVSGDLRADDRVILTNLDVIQDGARVKVQSHRTLSDELEGQRVQSARQLAGDGDDRRPVN